MKNLNISTIPARLVYFWWLSKIIKYFNKLIISKEQVYIFGTPSWDLYRDHMIYVRDDIGTMTMREYIQGKPKPVNCSGKKGSKALKAVELDPKKKYLIIVGKDSGLTAKDLANFPTPKNEWQPRPIFFLVEDINNIKVEEFDNLQDWIDYKRKKLNSS